MLKLLLAALCVGIASLASAQVKLEYSCPIGGQRFMVELQNGCGDDTHLNMLFMPVRGACLAQRIPQCPGNFLPLYKEFSADELPLVRQFIDMETYESAVDSSRYYLAYLITGFIGSDHPEGAFKLLWEGLNADGARSFADPVYTDAFFIEAQSMNNRAPDGIKPVIYALMAFVKTQTGAYDEAREYLTLSWRTRTDNALEEAYRTAVTSCISDHSSIYCNPNTPIPTD